MEYEVLRILADALYDHQDVRIRSMNRTRAVVRRKLLDLGFKPEKKKKKDEEKEVHWNDETLHKKLEEAHKSKKLNAGDRLLLENALKLGMKQNEIEREYEKELEPLIKFEPIHAEWLSKVKGVGIRNSTRLLKHFGYCERFDNVAKLWAYSGYSVGDDGKAIRREKGKKLPYSLKIKTDCFIVGDNLIKASASYKKFYDKEKKRLMKMKEHKEKTKMHLHRMAMRKMIKLFLSHYWHVTRTLKGLPTRSPYAIEKLGHQTYIAPFVDKTK